MTLHTTQYFIKAIKKQQLMKPIIYLLRKFHHAFQKTGNKKGEAKLLMELVLKNLLLGANRLVKMHDL